MLPLYSNGRTTGIVAQLGKSTTRAVPSFECFIIPGANMKSPIGGSAITDHLVNLLNSEGEM